jgi:3-oxoacyl-[acyl-carrier protein] reductase
MPVCTSQRNGEPFSSLTLAELRTLFDVNVLGVVSMTQACRPSMTEWGGGSVVNISSAIAGYLSHSPHGVTKVAVRGLTVAYARGLGPSGIRVNGIAPGVVYSDSGMSELGEEGLAKYQAGQALDGRVEVRDVVQAMLFLVSEDADDYRRDHQGCGWTYLDAVDVHELVKVTGLPSGL